MTKQTQHEIRIAAELHDAGASNYGSTKFASKYLPTVIHPDEHIMAVVYGRYKENEDLLGLSAGMLVATDRRVIFLDHKPGFTSMDEITYEVVSGIKHASTGLFSTLTLHTRVADYTIRFANMKGAEKFTAYIESRTLETRPQNTVKPVLVQTVQQGTVEPAAISFLRTHDVAVLSTVDRTGNVHGATVYYYLDSADNICMMTKSSTQKARDIFANQQVALTVYDADKAQTVQLQGTARVVSDGAEYQAIFDAIVRLRLYDGEVHMPPVSKIHDESYLAIRITPTNAHYVDYKLRQ